MKTRLTVTVTLTKRCTRACKYCIADKTDAGDINFSSVIRWCDKFAKGCDIHLSGGEPLILDNIEEIASRAIDAGHRVSVFTNGDLLYDKHPLLSMPIVWHMTHHKPQSINDFLAKAEIIRNKPHVVTAMYYGREILRDADYEAKKYNGLNFHWQMPGLGRVVKGFALKSDDAGCIASGVIHLIENDGNVYPCSTKRLGVIGNVYDMTYEKPDLIADENADLCVKNGRCSAYQSAVLLGDLHK